MFERRLARPKFAFMPGLLLASLVGAGNAGAAASFNVESVRAAAAGSSRCHENGTSPARIRLVW